jgi:hypothetical protein
MRQNTANNYVNPMGLDISLDVEKLREAINAA